MINSDKNKVEGSCISTRVARWLLKEVTLDREPEGLKEGSQAKIKSLPNSTA